jgi:hypothetical protein
VDLRAPVGRQLLLAPAELDIAPRERVGAVVTACRACCAALELVDWKLWSPCLSRLQGWPYDVGRRCVFGWPLLALAAPVSPGCRINEQAVLLSMARLELGGR